ncbi:MAG: hypothetical protein JRG93_06670 [Deltaproteobacteria bacterium]|nr:hypothetical protein [Deltaproteobacteria bacterium]
MARALLSSGAMQPTTTCRPHSPHVLPSILALIAFTAALAFFAPTRASADSPTAIRGAATAVMAIRAATSIRVTPNPTVLRPAPKPATMGFISADLLNTATDLINNGIRLGNGPGNGTFYVHAESRGFGGVLSIRYRR